MGPIGVQEMIFIFLLALLLFGPKKLPELGRMLGKGLSEFRRAKNELKTTFESHMRELEREANSSSYNNTPTTYSPKPYSYPYDEQGQNQSSDPYRPYDHDYSPPAEAITASQVENGASEGQTEQPKVEPVPLAGTVARTNGTQPTVGKEEEHHA